MVLLQVIVEFKIWHIFVKGSLPPNPSRLLPHTTFLEEFLGTLLSRVLIKVLITELIHSLDIHIASCSELLCIERLELSYRYSSEYSLSTLWNASYQLSYQLSTPFLIYLYRTSLFECTVLGISLGGSIGRSLINYLISYLRKVLGSFFECLYWFGSLPLCSFFLYLYAFALYVSTNFIWVLISITLYLSLFLSIRSYQYLYR